MNLSMRIKSFSCLFLPYVMTLSGCATPVGPDIVIEPKRTISSISVVVGDFAPGGIPSNVKPGNRTSSDAIIGAAPGAVGMAGVAPMCANPYTAGVCAVFLPIFGMLTVAGGTAGAAHGESAGSMKAHAQHALAKAISEDAAQRTLVEKVTEYGTTSTNRSFNQKPNTTTDKPLADAYLEVGMLKADGIEIQGGFWGIVSTHYAVSLEARARLKRRSDGVVLADRTYLYVSVPRTPQEWSRDEGRRLIAEIDNGYRQLAEWFIDDFFLSLQEPKTAQVTAKVQENAVFGEVASSKPAEYPQPVMPIPMEPAVNFCKPIVISGIPFPPIQLIDLMAAVGQAAIKKPCDKSTPYITVASLTPTAVDSLRPTLRWNFEIDSQRHSLDSMQSDSSKPLTPVRSASIPVDTLSNMRYEVRVFLAEEIPSLHSGKKKELRAITPIYEKVGLVDSFHMLEKNLEPCSLYFWTARAMFELDGVTRSTEWAGNYWSIFFGNIEPAKLRKASSNVRMLMLGKPSDYAFPFSTPCESKPADQASNETNNIFMAAKIQQSPETKKPTSGQSSSSPSGSAPKASTRLSDTVVVSLPSVEGTFLSKEIKTGGLAGLSKGIDLKLSLTNISEKDIVKLSGRAKLFDDSGNKIGSFLFHSENRIPSHDSIEIIQTLYPIVFFGYSKLKELAQEKIRAEFTFESIEFADGSKATK